LKKLTIVAPTIKTGGGKELLLYLIDHLVKEYPEVEKTIYLHKNINIESIQGLKIIHIDSPKKILLLYGRRFKNVLYFGNLPPYRKTEKSAVYFHNRYLLLSTKELLHLKESKLIHKILNLIRQLYLKMFASNVDYIICQNEAVKKGFQKKYNYENIKILPFFRNCEKNLPINEKLFDFCYISLAHPHKNHLNLLRAIGILAKKGKVFKVALTVEYDKTEILSEIENINRMGGVEIINFGPVSKTEVCKIYSKSKCLIFPSTSESFGLPLVEASEVGLDVIAANLSYTFEVIEPSMTFDPYNPKEIATCMDKFLKGKTKRAKTKVKNEIDTMIKSVL